MDTDWRKYKWQTFLVSDEQLGKKYKGVKKKGLRPILIYSLSMKLSDRVLYLEMSTHPEIGNPDTSVKVAEWISKKTNTKEESWVLVNRIGLFNKGELLNSPRGREIKKEYRKEIKEKFSSLYDNEIVKQLIKQQSVNKTIEEQKRILAKKVVEESRTKEKMIKDFCNIKNLDELVKLQEKLKNELAEKKQEEKKKDNEEEQENEFNLK
ncbi:MAG: hypothetical protein LBC44_00615 [Mycoplasmataceae bacterium]|nr:hypothetical protein [Mycoplasmataceae bacterium]